MSFIFLRYFVRNSSRSRGFSGAGGAGVMTFLGAGTGVDVL